MKNGKWLLIILTALLVSVVCLKLSSAAYIPESADLEVSLISQDPDPAEPGEYVEVRWKVINNGTKDAEDVVFELLLGYPFSLDPGESAIKNVGNVWGLQRGEKGIILYYKIKVDEDAVEGENEIKLKAYMKGNFSRTFNFTIRVQTVDAALGIYSAVTDPGIIVPGEESKIEITLKNLADSVMKDITLKLDLSSDDLPFVPIGDSTEKRIKHLKPGEEEKVEFNVAALANADSQIYKIPISLTYYDELGEKYIKDDLIGVIVGATPDLLVQIDSSTIFKEKSTGEITVKIVNKGLIDVKFLTISIDSAEDYDVLSASEIYVGSVDSDDYETADFKLYVKDSVDKKVVIPITVKYMDANNNKYTEKHDLMLDLKSASMIAGKGDGSLGTIAIVLLIVGIAYYFYKHRRKRRNKKYD